MIGTYTLLNETNKRIYIGQSTNFPQRRKDHLNKLRRGNHRNIHLQRAYNKYGKKDFTWTFQPCPVEKLTEMEQFYIDSFDPRDLFNINLDAARPPDRTGRTHSESTLEKLRGRTPWNKGKKMSAEYKRVRSEAGKGNKIPQSQIEATRKRMTERDVSLDTKRKMSNAKSTFTDDEAIEVWDKYQTGLYSQLAIALEKGWSRGKVRNAMRYYKEHIDKFNL